MNGTGFDGIDIEIAAAIAEKLGLELQVDDMDFDAALTAVQQGKCDFVLAGLTYNEARPADDLLRLLCTGAGHHRQDGSLTSLPPTIWPMPV